MTTHPVKGKFYAMINIDKRPVYLGSFDTPEEAGAAYQRAALELHGEFARPTNG